VAGGEALPASESFDAEVSQVLSSGLAQPRSTGPGGPTWSQMMDGAAQTAQAANAAVNAKSASVAGGQPTSRTTRDGRFAGGM
jgi:hypothetical protein